MVDGDKLDIDHQPNTANDMAVSACQITDELGRHSMNVMGSPFMLVGSAYKNNLLMSNAPWKYHVSW